MGSKANVNVNREFKYLNQSAHVFNSMPHIDEPQSQRNLDKEAEVLLGIAKDFDMVDSVSVFRVHKHFDISSGMVKRELYG